MSETQELAAQLVAAGFETGWVLRGGKIVIWFLDEVIPAQFADFVELD